MQAAFLDLKATSFISRLLHSVAPKCPDEPAAVPVADMIVKVLSWLCDPDICLNSLTTVSERLKTDHPSVAETSNLVAALLSNLVHLKGEQITLCPEYSLQWAPSSVHTGYNMMMMHPEFGNEMPLLSWT